MNKILVTGGCGFIGSNLIKRLISEGHYVHSLDDYSSGLRSNEIEGCHYHSGDIRSVNLMDKNFDTIYHTAAISRIQPSFQNPIKTFEVNVEGTIEVLEFGRKIGAKVIFTSSSSIHSGKDVSPYTLSKSIGEDWGKMYNKIYGLDFRVARLYNVYGMNELVDSPMAAIIGLFRNAVNKDEPIQIHGDGRQRRDFTHIDDIVDGLIKVAETKNYIDNIWELGTGVHYSINDVYDMFRTKFPTLEKKYVEDVKGNYRDSLRVNNEAIDKLGWQPKDRLKNYINSL